MRIAFVTSEIVPFSKTGGLADVSGSLPIALEEIGLDVLIITPKYKGCDFNDAKIGKNINVHLISNDEFFKRDGLYGDKYGDYKDNLERFSYFSREVLAYLEKAGFKADIIHCNDWQSSLVPVYLKTSLRSEDFFKNMKTLLTIHNIAYQGIFKADQYDKIGIGKEYFNIECLEYHGKINLLKGGIIFSDFINTVSPTYAKEIQTPEFGYGLDGFLRRHSSKISGILNGVDYALWDPSTDNKIKKSYSAKSIKDKYVNKEDIQETCGLEINKDIPLIGIVSRLAHQKGIDMLVDVLGDVIKEGAQFVLLGTGELEYHRMLEEIKKKFAKKVSINLKFDAILARKIYAGCDMFLMPSRYEPCGLGQMISLKYGTIPIVCSTGGLADTIKEFNSATLDGNGFVFSGYDDKQFLEAIKRALEVYKNKKLWHHIVEDAMNYDFSWTSSAKEYRKLYEKLKAV